MSKAAYDNQITVMLCFDDGRRDVYDYAVKELIAHKIPATFSIITSFIEGGARWPGDIEALPMTMDQLYLLNINHLFEIANHSDTHRIEWTDIQRGKDKLFLWLGKNADEKIGFTSPGSKQSKAWFSEHETQFRKAGYVYVRTGGCWQTKRKLRIFCRKASRIIHSGMLYSLAYEDTLLSDEERYVLTAVPVMHDITLHQIKSLIRFAQRKGKNCIIMLHSILPEDHPDYDNPWVWGENRFLELVDYLNKERNNGRIRLMNIKKYASGNKERTH